MRTVQAVVTLAVTVLLTSCAVTVQPGAAMEVHTAGVSGNQLVNDRLRLTSYPGSVVVQQEQKERSSKTTFETEASLDAVYSHFHSQLANQGWQRRELESKPNRVEAEYTRRDEGLELKLNREGQSGRYRLDLELDD